MKAYSDFSIQTISLEQKNYPKILKELSLPPKQIYYRGDLKSIDFDKCLAVVGSRLITSYGKQVLERFIPDFVASGATIVSGFMYGVDTLAHELAVKYGGKTIAVFGNGLDIVYPVENNKLYSQILNTGGVVLSEYNSNHKPHLWTYPQRNRIVAALSKMGVLVIEAGEKSGSLVTVKWARKLKRKIYAVPGPITSVASAGTNYILQNAQAKMVVKSSDIINIEHKSKQEKAPLDMSSLEAKIYQSLLRENFTLDELALVIDEEITKVSAEISIMSLKGKINEVGGKLYLT